jgi:hypothetical protein
MLAMTRLVDASTTLTEPPVCPKLFSREETEVFATHICLPFGLTANPVGVWPTGIFPVSVPLLALYTSNRSFEGTVTYTAVPLGEIATFIPYNDGFV